MAKQRKGRRAHRFDSADRRAARTIDRYLVRSSPAFAKTREYGALKMLAGTRRINSLTPTQVKSLAVYADHLTGTRHNDVAGAIRELLRRSQ